MCSIVTRDNYYMCIAEEYSKFSTCKRRNVGALVVKDDLIIGCGYNGIPAYIGKDITCKATNTCIRENSEPGLDLDKCRGYRFHAEVIAVKHALLNSSLVGASIFVTASPCTECAKIIINVGIKKVYYRNYYPNNYDVDHMFEDAGVEFIKVENL